MTRSIIIGMDTRNTPSLEIHVDVLSNEVVKMKFPLLPLDRYYSVWLVVIDTYPEVLKKMYFYSITWNVTVSSKAVSVVTI